jgi:hypothetical protein
MAHLKTPTNQKSKIGQKKGQQPIWARARGIAGQKVQPSTLKTA